MIHPYYETNQQKTTAKVRSIQLWLADIIGILSPAMVVQYTLSTKGRRIAIHTKPHVTHHNSKPINNILIGNIRLVDYELKHGVFSIFLCVKFFIFCLRDTEQCPNKQMVQLIHVTQLIL